MAANLRLVPAPPAPPAEEPLTQQQSEWIEEGMVLLEPCEAEVARSRAGVVKGELLGAGFIALREAACAFEPERHPSFLHYARMRIRGRMFDAVRRDRYSLRARVERAMEHAYAGLAGEEVPDVDMCFAPKEEVRAAVRESAANLLAAAVLAGALQAEQPTPEEDLGEREEYERVLATLQEGLRELPAHELSVVKLIYEEELTAKEVARKVGVSARAVQRRQASALKKLRAFFRERAKDLCG